MLQHHTAVPVMASQGLAGTQALCSEFSAGKGERTAFWAWAGGKKGWVREKDPGWGQRNDPSMGSPSNHRTHGGSIQTREATRGRSGPPECLPRAAVQGEVHIPFILTTSTFRGALDWGTCACSVLSAVTVFMHGNACVELWTLLTLKERQSSENPSPRGHGWSALLDSETILLPTSSMPLSRHLCVHPFIDWVLILSHVAVPSHIQHQPCPAPAPKPPQALAPPWSGRGDMQPVLP